MGDRALVRLGTTMITEKESKSRREIDPCSLPQGLIPTSISRNTSIRSPSRTPRPPIRADVRNGKAPSDTMGIEGEGERQCYEGSSSEPSMRMSVIACRLSTPKSR